MNKRLTKISKYLSFILRHEPESIGMTLDPEGWLEIETLVQNANARGKSIQAAQIHEVIALSEEKRFEISEDSLRIRAVN